MTKKACDPTQGTRSVMELPPEQRRERERRRLASIVELPEDDPEIDEILDRVLARTQGPADHIALTPDDVTASSRARVWWLCPKCGAEWKARVCDRVAGEGCPECGNNSTTETE
jgi:hypothetical protein